MYSMSEAAKTGKVGHFLRLLSTYVESSQESSSRCTYLRTATVIGKVTIMIFIPLSECKKHSAKKVI
jgi:hypothetical protein